MEIKPVFFRSKHSSVVNSSAPLPGETTELPEDASLEKKIIAAIRTVYDPEIAINIYDLGLVYKIDINHDAPLCQHTCRLKNLVLGDKNGKIYPGI
ncbi:MAG: DUF59 domain-containing protein [gamma proteobacterium symbiont of Bathyaustriella thionipta]|nr:DUF59 domain-containing protein [gamma proteobacterium symbiont of Bathyaustriella thionipta]MCU7951727.1 DUF59 domain-containing protein [gamma proteobacterium symbiont of Bathyaustriella thionipta]MCU7958325.1 DUF59 domain-containing protein [gamma proteobacterium symbiont of Bathyaustriella thionipta]MCU7968787.1 DUF59 domain-containing protein [gamma proteobacterium symbiont of Bathyaustriella thionipta]